MPFDVPDLTWGSPTFPRPGTPAIDVYGGGNYVERADGKMLLTYNGPGHRIMLSVVDREQDLFEDPDCAAAGEFEFLQMEGSAEGGIRRNSCLVHAANGNLLLLVQDVGQEGVATSSFVDCYRSVNGLGTDFALFDNVSVLSGTPTSILNDPHLGQPIVSGSRILVPCILSDTLSGNWVPSAYILRSDDHGDNWSGVRIDAGSSPFDLDILQCKAIGSFSNGLFTIVQDGPQSGGAYYESRLYRSTDNGTTWSSLGTLPSGISQADHGLGCCIQHGGDGYNYLWFFDHFTQEARLYCRPATLSLSTTPADALDTTQSADPTWAEVSDGALDLDAERCYPFVSESGRVVMWGTELSGSDSAVVTIGSTSPQVSGGAGSVRDDVHGTPAHVIAARGGRSR